MTAHVFVLLMVYFGAPSGSQQIVPGALAQPFPSLAACQQAQQAVVDRVNADTPAGLVGLTAVCAAVDVTMPGLKKAAPSAKDSS